MKPRFLLSSLLAMAVGGIVGYVVALSETRSPVQASDSSPRSQKLAPLSLTDDSDSTDQGCCSLGLSRTDQFALVNHNQMVTATLMQTGKKPNFLVIWGDDIGTWNISFNNRGMMGYRTPNIDRIAKEGLSFTDYYGQQSCTVGRAAFLGGNVPVRTGMTKVGLPGAKEGWQKTDVTIASVMKSLACLS